LPSQKASVHVHHSEQSSEDVQRANDSHDNQQALFKTNVSPRRLGWKTIRCSWDNKALTHSSLIPHAVDDYGVLLVPLPEVPSFENLMNMIEQNETTARLTSVLTAKKSRSIRSKSY
jgi:hypothetical protein